MRRKDRCNDVKDGGQEVGVLKVVLVLGDHLVGDDEEGPSFEEEEDAFATESDEGFDLVVKDGDRDEEESQDDENDAQGWMVFSGDGAFEQDDHPGEDV